MAERESVNVLKECIDLQIKKSQDYQNPNSSVVQAMHYRRGVDTIHDMLHQKMLRALSLIEAAHTSEDTTPNFESLEDTYKDIINYASFAVSYLRGKMEGQNAKNDLFNRPKPIKPINTIISTGVGSIQVTNVYYTSTGALLEVSKDPASTPGQPFDVKSVAK
jgi:hypothetical protein